MIIKTLKDLVERFRAEGHTDIVTPVNDEALFILKYGRLAVGYLSLQAGLWRFQYTEDFAEQSEVQPLVAFPDLRKVYTSESLWSFFLARIPSLTQPAVREAIQREGFDETNGVELLRLFGKKSIANPFVLTFDPMWTDKYAMVRDALARRLTIIATYDGFRRHLQPWALGAKNGIQRCLFYQSEGLTASGPVVAGSPNNWRCLDLARLEIHDVIEEHWDSSNARRSSHCLDTIDIDVTKDTSVPHARR